MIPPAGRAGRAPRPARRPAGSPDSRRKRGPRAAPASSGAPPPPRLARSLTGGAGYIGSHTCKALAAAGFTPVTYDNLATGHRRAVKWGPLEEGDLADRARLDAAIARHAPRAVIHFAASSAAGESVVDPGAYYRNNVAGSLSLLEAMRDHRLGALAFSSTAAVYGAPL